MTSHVNTGLAAGVKEGRSKSLTGLGIVVECVMCVRGGERGVLVGVCMGGVPSCEPFGGSLNEGVIIGVPESWSGGEGPVSLEAFKQ